MKKLILLTALLICSFLQAQNQEIINKMIESKTLSETESLAKDIASKSKTKYVFYKTIRKTTRDEAYQYIVYNKEVMTASEKEELISNNYKNCLVVRFGEWNKGENKDLEIKGDLVYYFKEVSSKFLDLAPFWISTFYSDITPEQLIDNYKLKEFRVNKDLKYKFVKNEDSWTILKSY